MMNLERITFDYTDLDKQLLITQSRVISIIQHRVYAKCDRDFSYKNSTSLYNKFRYARNVINPTCSQIFRANCFLFTKNILNDIRAINTLFSYFIPAFYLLSI